MFLILLIIALLLAIPTYGISLVIFVCFYGYQVTSFKKKLTQLISSMPDATSTSLGYEVDVKLEQILAYAQELGKVTHAPSSYSQEFSEGVVKTIAGPPENVEFEIVIEGYKYKVSAERHNDKSIIKRIGNPLSIELHKWLSSFRYGEIETPPNDIMFIERVELGSINGEYTRDIGILPQNFFNLEHTEELYLQNCGLTYIQEDILNLSRLKDLKLGGNRLSTLPQSIGYLKELRILTVWMNDLVQLPEEIGFLINLKGLDLSSNPIRKLPDSIVNLVNLEVLELFSVPNLVLTSEQQEWIMDLEKKGCNVSKDEHLSKTKEYQNVDDIPF